MYHIVACSHVVEGGYAELIGCYLRTGWREPQAGAVGSQHSIHFTLWRIILLYWYVRPRLVRYWKETSLRGGVNVHGLVWAQFEQIDLISKATDSLYERPLETRPIRSACGVKADYIEVHIYIEVKLYKAFGCSLVHIYNVLPSQLFSYNNFWGPLCWGILCYFVNVFVDAC